MTEYVYITNLLEDENITQEFANAIFNALIVNNCAVYDFSFNGDEIEYSTDMAIDISDILAHYKVDERALMVTKHEHKPLDMSLITF